MNCVRALFVFIFLVLLLYFLFALFNLHPSLEIQSKYHKRERESVFVCVCVWERERPVRWKLEASERKLRKNKRLKHIKFFRSFTHSFTHSLTLFIFFPLISILILINKSICVLPHFTPTHCKKQQQQQSRSNKYIYFLKTESFH